MAAQPSPKEFQPYRKLQSATEAELRRILELTAKQIEQRVGKLKPGIGGQVRAAQLKVTLAAVNRLLRQMWVGRINPLVARAIEDSLKASEDAVETMTRVAYAGLPEQAAEALTRGLRASGESGLLSDAARRARELSPRVYRQQALDDGKIEEVIRSGLISGLSAKELARDAYKYVSPNTKGGASYAAMRLARTEINNAFHERQVDGAKRPGVRAAKWNLSGSHRVPDLCNEYATHGGNGEWPPEKIPDKPHPQCFCFLTYLTTPSEGFRKQLQAGEFDDEIDRRTRENMARLGQPVGRVTPVTVEKTKSSRKQISSPKDVPAIGAPIDRRVVSVLDIKRFKAITQKVEGDTIRAKVVKALSGQSVVIPKTMAKFKGVRTANKREQRDQFQAGGGMAAYVNGEIIVSTSMADRNFESSYARQSKAGWLTPCGHKMSGVEGVIAHECGHHVSANISPAGKKELWIAIAKELGERNPPKDFTEKGLDRWITSPFVKKKAGNISKYASENSDEFLAEVWNEYTTNADARPIVKTIGALMESLVEGYSR